NEAIELAKTFGGENSGKFVNGVLGTIYRELGEPGKEDAAKKQLTPEEIKKLPVEACAGAVVWRKENNNYYIAFVHDVFGRWTLPKGHLEKGETAKEGAARKVEEEIGVHHLDMGEKIGEIEYVAHDPETGPVRRAVIYFLARTGEKELKLKITGGLDDARWFPADELEHITTYDDIKEILHHAKKTLGIA
ncbi:MAG: NUDIX hydrolase, partial [Parcubacteria group bacterium Gr01-1014_70]